MFDVCAVFVREGLYDACSQAHDVCRTEQLSLYFKKVLATVILGWDNQCEQAWWERLYAAWTKDSTSSLFWSARNNFTVVLEKIRVKVAAVLFVLISLRLLPCANWVVTSQNFPMDMFFVLKSFYLLCIDWYYGYIIFHLVMQCRRLQY
jgi:hypothetical protein